MRYLLAIFGEEGGMDDATPEEMKASMDAWTAVTQDLKDSGAFIAGEGLQPSATATTIKIGAEGEEPAVTDGPFAETKEQLGGFYLIDVDDLDLALGWAKKLPLRGGAVEVRPVMEFDEEGEAAGQDGAKAEASA